MKSTRHLGVIGLGLAGLLALPGSTAFGQAGSDSEGALIMYVASQQAPVVNQWTHVAGVYDYTARQLRDAVVWREILGPPVGARDLEGRGAP